MILTSPTVALISPLSIAEASHRVRASLDQGDTIRGRGKEDYFVIRKRLPFTARNSFQTILFLNLYQEPSRTLVVCEFRMPISALIFVGLFFLVGFSSSCLIVNGMLNMHSFDLTALTFAILFPLSGPLILLIGRYIARNEPKDLVAFLMHRLQARPYETSD